MTHPKLGDVGGLPARPPWNGRDRFAQQGSPLGLGLLLLLCSWLLIRRWAGALEQPLDMASFVATAVLLGVWAGGVRWAWCASRRLSQARPAWIHHVFGALTTVGVLTFGAALSLPGSPAGALCAFWCVLLAVEVGWGFAFHARHSPGDRARTDAEVPAAAGQVTAAGVRSALAFEFPLVGSNADSEAGEFLASDQSQRVTRARDSQGGEVVSGLVRCSFGPSERQRDIHLAFCPPLKRAPHFSAEQVEGPPARIRASLVETFGVGLEIKLASISSEPTSIQIQFFACEESIDGESG